MKNALEVSPAEVPMPKKAAKRPAEDTDNRGELNGLNVELTENGCIVRCSFDPKNLNPKLPRYEQMPEDEKMSFDDMGKAGEYIMGMLKKHSGEEVEEEKPAKKGPAGGKKAEEEE